MPVLLVSLENQTVVPFEIDEAPGQQPASTATEYAAHAGAAFAGAVDRLKELGAEIYLHLRDGFPEKPDEIEVTMGLKASGELGGFIVAKASGECSCTVKLKWTKGERT